MSISARRTGRRIPQQILITEYPPLYGFKPLCTPLIKIQGTLNPYRMLMCTIVFCKVVIAEKSVRSANQNLLPFAMISSMHVAIQSIDLWKIYSEVSYNCRIRVFWNRRSPRHNSKTINMHQVSLPVEIFSKIIHNLHG
jgi:hypothetical protein